MQYDKPLSTDPNALLREANRRFEAGHLSEAALLYQQLHANFPPQSFVLNPLAQIAMTSGHVAEAIELMRQSLQIAPGQPTVLGGLGVAYHRVKRFDDALASYDRALEIAPGFAVVHCKRGELLAELKRGTEALASFDRAIAMQPDFADAHNNRGNLLRQQRRLGDALESYDRAIGCGGDFAIGHYNRGIVLADLGRVEEALRSYERALAIHPGYAEAHNNRGVLLAELGRLDEALSGYDRAIGLRPRYAEAHNNRGMLLVELERVDDALAAFATAIALSPDYAEACNNQGLLLADLRRLDEAMLSHERAIAARPDFAEAHTIKAELLLLQGEYAQGWELYEWRWKSKFRQGASPASGLPIWSGREDLAGKTVLVLPEVGLGDFIMFVRYARLIRRRGATVVVATPAPLVPLFATLGDDIVILEDGEAMPHVDLQCPVMSLPRAFGTTIATIPAEVPYLAVLPDKQNDWRVRLGPSGRLRVGLTWSGKADRNVDRRPLRTRSIPLELLEPLLELPLEFHALQTEVLPRDAAALQRFASIHMHQDELVDFSDTAAMVEAMDLVISIDTSVAHLAGALGKPLWVLLPTATDYRWSKDGETTPWYPLARLFRQTAAGDWSTVVRRVVASLRDWTRSG